MILFKVRPSEIKQGRLKRKYKHMNINTRISAAKLFALSAAVLLAACAQPRMATSDSWREQTEMPDFTADGRLAVKVNEKGSYANFDWTHQNQVQTMPAKH